jgi:DNA-binding NarL/FixJ family response regulator
VTDAIRIVIAEDQAIVRAGFRALLDAEPDMTVVGEAATGRAAIELAASEHPDVVLMDIRMPELDGLEATRHITGNSDLQGVRILVLTTFELDEYVFAALRGGASGFLLKGGEPPELINAVRVVAAGDAVLAPAVTSRLITAYVSQPSNPTASTELEALTPRELEVLDLVAHGKNNQEIADLLYLSPLTAKTHVSRILAKLGLRDRVQLVIAAYNAGRVTPASSGETSMP